MNSAAFASFAAALGIGAAVSLGGPPAASADPGDRSSASADQSVPDQSVSDQSVSDQSGARQVARRTATPRAAAERRRRHDNTATDIQRPRIAAAVRPMPEDTLPTVGRGVAPGPAAAVEQVRPAAFTPAPTTAVVRPDPAPVPAAVRRAAAGLIGGSAVVGTTGDSPAQPVTPSPADAVAVTFIRRETARARGGSRFRNVTPTMNPAQTGQGAGGVVTGSLNPVDPDSPVLSFTVTRAPAHGVVAVASDGGYTYTPDPALASTGVTDSFDVRVSDAASGRHFHARLGRVGHTSTATVAVVVTPFDGTNHAPTATAVVDSADSVSGHVTGRVLGVDADQDPLTYTGPTTTAKGTVGIDAVSGAFTYDPTDTARQNAAAPGAGDAERFDSFTVSVSDGHGGAAGVLVTVPVVPAPGAEAPLAAFPGAEGFGAYATGGRGGSVIYVTNLNANGPGSLQWAIDQPGARYILFKVSGVIDTQIHLTNGDVTIAGQTSPGGITVRGFVTDETPYQDQTVKAPADFAENWILQQIRIRPGADGPSDDGLRIRYTRNAIVDHVSIGNATDEAIEISYSHDITVQNTLLAETVGVHSFYGGILLNYSNPAYGFGLDNVSLHHNVFNRIEGRLPEGSRESLAAANSYMNLEMSNNLYWDPNFFVALGLTTNSLTDSHGNPYPIYWNLNAVNNYFRTRSDFPYGMFDDQILRTPRNNLYVSGNKMNLYPTRSDYELFYCCNDYASVTDPNTSAQVAHKLPVRNPFPSITYTPTDQLVNLLLNTAGAWPRDPMDIRLMRSVATNTIATAPRNTNPVGDALLAAFAGPAPLAPTDTDSDGMPDVWETAKGLDPNVANTNAHTLSGLGYTDLEVYLQELSASRVTGWAG